MSGNQTMDSQSTNHNEASTAVPEGWLHSPPFSLVVGDGAHARSLAFVFGCELFLPTNLLAMPAEIPGQGYPRVLGNLERVFLVATSASSPADLLRWHKAIWEWVARLSRNGDQHDLAICFALPNTGGANLFQSLLTGLALNGLETHLYGHGIVHMTDGLPSLLTSIGKIRPMDLVALDARRRSHVRHAAINRLRTALSHSDQAAIREATKAVEAAFTGEEYQLDLFCRPPAHRHGNAIRQWLASAVTGEVTPEQWQEQRSAVADWLALPQNELRS